MKELKKYYRQISSWLPCGGPLKKQLMGSITATVEGYLAEHPEADFLAIQAHFGTPQQIATAFVDEMETAELLIKLHMRNRIIKIIFLCACILIAIWGFAVLSFWLIGLLDILGPTTISPPVIID